MRDEAPERRTIGQQDGEVIEADSSPRGHGLRAGTLVQTHERNRVTHGAQIGAPISTREQLEAEHALIVRERSLEISHLQVHPAHPRRRRQSGRPVARCPGTTTRSSGRS